MSALGFLLNLITDSDDFDGEIFDDSSEISDDSSNISDDSSETADSSPETSEVPPNTPNDESATDNTSLNADTSKLCEDTSAPDSSFQTSNNSSNTPDEPSNTSNGSSETTDNSSEASYHETNININLNRRSRLPQSPVAYIVIALIVIAVGIGLCIFIENSSSNMDYSGSSYNFGSTSTLNAPSPPPTPSTNADLTGWRNNVTEADTEHCINDIISSKFNYKIINNLSSSEKEKIAKGYILNAAAAMQVIKKEKNDADIVDILLTIKSVIDNNEEQIYIQSKGRYKCNIESIAEYKVRDYKGSNQIFPDIFKQFVYQFSDLKPSDDAEVILAVAYTATILSAYTDFQPSANAPTPSPYPADDNLDAQAKSIASRIAQNVMYEIRLEEGKSVGQFFSIKKALKPCKKKPASCEEKIAPLVEESFVKYKRGIAATILLLNNNKFDKQLFNKIETELKRNYDSFGKMKSIANNSPVGREIMNANFIDDDTKKQIFYIWYLRQYPYAGEDIWKNQYKPSYDWKEYLNMADNYID